MSSRPKAHKITLLGYYKQQLLLVFFGLSKLFIQTSHHVHLLVTLQLLLREKPVHFSSAGEIKVLGSCSALERCTHIILPGMLFPKIQKHHWGVYLPMWFVWQIKVGTQAEAGNWCYNYIITDIKALVS